jgi:hypothetical protein
MMYIQICNEFSDKSIYFLEAHSISEARKLASLKLKQYKVHHVNLFYENGVHMETFFKTFSE